MLMHHLGVLRLYIVNKKFTVLPFLFIMNILNKHIITKNLSA